jgi:hypothetical protein
MGLSMLVTCLARVDEDMAAPEMPSPMLEEWRVGHYIWKLNGGFGGISHSD